MVNCDRPARTFCFVLVWVLVVQATLMTYVSLNGLLPHLKDLPKNLASGFDETFKFSYLNQDAARVKSLAAIALKKCHVVAHSACPAKSNLKFRQQGTVIPQQISTTATEQRLIIARLENSLIIVSIVALDRYLGIQGLSETAKLVSRIVANVDKLEGTMPCNDSSPVFCDIYASASGIASEMNSVNKAIETFKANGLVERWEANQDGMFLLLGLPCSMVVTLVFFAYFWSNGVRCSCRTCLAIISYVFFWLMSFTIYALICAIGIGVTYAADKIEVPVLKGKPSLEAAVGHIKTAFPEFWDLVFADMENGLGLLLRASYLALVGCLLIALSGACDCCCRLDCWCRLRKSKPSKATEDDLNRTATLQHKASFSFEGTLKTLERKATE